MAPAILRESLAVFTKEVRSLGRDRHTFLYSVLLPLFLYPCCFWGMIQVAAYVRGIQDRKDSRVLLADGSTDKTLRRLLAGTPKLGTIPVDSLGENEVRAQIDSGSADAAVLATADPEGGERVRILYSEARGASARAKRRLEDALNEHRRDRLRAAARSVEEDESFLDVLAVERKDLATPREAANHIASLILPLLMMVMTALGALYPALDVTAGERERGTLETTLVSPASRPALVAGKYLAVTAFALAACLLNFGSMAFTLSHLRSQLKLEQLVLGGGSVAVILCAAGLLALFLSAVMMVVGFLARTFKEGQAYVAPVYMLSLLPAFLGASEATVLTPVLAVVPMVNISLLFREALLGRFPVAGIVLTLASSALYGAGAIALAARLLKEEEFATGAGLRPRWSPGALLSFWKGTKRS